MHGPASDDSCPTHASYRRRDGAHSPGDPAWTCDASRIRHTAAHADRSIEHGAPTPVITQPMREVLPRGSSYQTRQGNFEIGRILHLKSETRNLKLDRQTSATRAVHSEFSDFGFEMQDSSNLKCLLIVDLHQGAAFHFPCATAGVNVSRFAGGKSTVRPCSALR
jgi:hypothetical protein